MTIKELNLLGETDFWILSLEKTTKVLDLLDNLYWLDTNDSNLKENCAFYEKLLSVIDYRFNCDDYEEIIDDTTQKNRLLFCVMRIRANMTQYRLSVLKNDVEREISKSSSTAIENINNYISTRYKNFEKSIDTSANEAIEKIEPQLMSTILTVMGVFSAIITIIMSVVITSSSWLNNANGASAIVAFVVPNLVTVLSITVLLGIVLRKKDNFVIIPVRDWDSSRVIGKQLKKLKKYFWGSLVLIIAFVAIVLAYALHSLEFQNQPHMRYVISPNIYDCVAVVDEKSGDTTVLIEFEFKQVNYRVEYDDSYFHDGNLFFCEEHQKLE